MPPALPFWQTSRYQVDLSRPRVMGIVNITPDSFSDGASHNTPAHAAAHCEALVKAGADILDIGGESTRPGATPVSLEDECARVLPVLRAALSLGVPVSLDTSQPELMREALGLGVDIINDVRALRLPGALAAVSAHPQAGVCLLHLRGEPGTMSGLTDYADVVAQVLAFLGERAAQVRAAGVAAARIVLDPGIGFAKTDAQNIELHRRLSDLLALGYPLLIGWSRKRTLGQLTGKPVQERTAASLAAALSAVHAGARIVRVHDVAVTVDALKVWQALQGDPPTTTLTANQQP